jgi:hypothetical protein
MVKAFSMGIGIFLLILGIVFHCIDGYTVKKYVRATTMEPFEQQQAELTTVEKTPEPWKPWAYIGAGLVIVLWTTTLPQKMQQK